ncbi:uncharacterized protein HMPREF1541_04465 [Cyphellophora europaea CBS 101466]|uniref:Uncharacterized protein n=1 Tax=Cyphellophora europaea (strain CBS 101466) TaxID=1220924 RepID=W2RWW3_CYPE1|nr:uncharacterized protein HMPREF1541_04465 [Cyphellophora europaea CBS 101466]ETN40189.1 hypothetical protein HMPREF1541_04465 [Cyphellophora europaea CBS 101466]
MVQRNYVIAIIVIVLFVLLALVGYAIYAIQNRVSLFAKREKELDEEEDTLGRAIELPPPPLAVPSAVAVDVPAPRATSPVFPVAYSYLQEEWEGAGSRRSVSGRLHWEDGRDTWF